MAAKRKIIRREARSDGYIQVWNEYNETNLLRSDGKLLSKVWFRKIGLFRIPLFNEGFAIVERDDCRHNYLKTDGTLLSKEWFTNATEFENGIAMVECYKDYRWYFIKEDGSFLSEMGFYQAKKFKEGFALVRITPQLYNFLKKDGELLLDRHYHDAREFENGKAAVYEFNNPKGPWFTINTEGNIFEARQGVQN